MNLAPSASLVLATMLNLIPTHFIAAAPRATGPGAACPTPMQTQFAAITNKAIASDDIQRVSHAGDEYEVLKGKPAISHVRNLRAQHARGFALAEQELRRRGFKPTEHAVVIRSIGKPFAPAQTTVDSSSGEVTFWSWDDGDDSTWEGTFYATTYDDSSYVLIDGQIDTNVHDVIWESLAYEYEGPISEGGGPDNQIRRQDRTRTSPFKLIAQRFSSPREILEVARTTNRPKPKPSEWIGCVVAGCTGSVVGCALSGPAYPECVVLGCGAASTIGCTFQLIINYWP
jgi:hypothetical protein